MNWSSVKNLLIAILIAANVFMLYNIARQDRTRNYIDEGEVADAVELLAERGMIVPADRIPLRMFRARIWESFYSDSYHTDAAKKLTGSTVPLFLQSDSSLSGISEDGVSVTFDTEFGFTYLKNVNSPAASYTDVTAEMIKNQSAGDSEVSASRMKSLSRAAREFLTPARTDDSPLDADITGALYDSGTGLTHLLAEQTIDGHRIFSHTAVLTFDGDALVRVQGRWYFADLDESYTTALQDQVTILFTDLNVLTSAGAEADYELSPLPVPTPTANTLRNVSAASAMEARADIPQVESMANGYIIYWNADKTALYFIPAWQIAHANADTIVYNAANGTIYSRN